MSRLDLLAELQGAAPAAPRELRERVREIAAVVPERRRLTWRRAAAVLVPAVVAVTAAAVVLGRGGQTTVRSGAVAGKSAPTTLQAQAGAVRGAAPVPPSRTRLQDYDATLSLRVRNPAALSDATRRAVAIARSLGGFAAAVDVSAAGRQGDATIRLRVPVTHVEDALARLSALGRITGESTQVQDVQAGVNALDREIARLQRQLRALRAGPQTAAAKRRIAALTAQVQRLQRQRAGTVRTARLATISLQLTTRTPPAPPRPVHHGPLHGAVVALEWLGIGALYALVVGGPVALVVLCVWLAVRVLRRRSERRLLERP
jgi:hypothetical protein